MTHVHTVAMRDRGHFVTVRVGDDVLCTLVWYRRPTISMPGTAAFTVAGLSPVMSSSLMMLMCTEQSKGHVVVDGIVGTVARFGVQYRGFTALINSQEGLPKPEWIDSFELERALTWPLHASNATTTTSVRNVRTLAMVVLE